MAVKVVQYDHFSVNSGSDLKASPSFFVNVQSWGPFRLTRASRPLNTSACERSGHRDQSLLFDKPVGDYQLLRRQAPDLDWKLENIEGMYCLYDKTNRLCPRGQASEVVADMPA